MRLPIDKINIGDRIRKDFGNIDDLVESIKEFGVLQPIIIDRKYNLVIGGRRLEAAKRAGKTEIEVHFTDEISSQRLLEMELEENVQRKDLEWFEEVEAKRRLHIIKKASAIVQGQNWDITDTAKLINGSVGVLSEDIQLAEGVRDHPELLLEKNKSTAFRKLKRIREVEATKALADKIEVDLKPIIACKDCREFLSTEPDNSYDMILTDPMWGIAVDSAAAIGEKVEYDDSEQYMKEVLSKAYPEFFRVLKPGGHAFIFFGIQHYKWHIVNLSLAGFEVDVIPGIWNKGSKGAGSSLDRENNCYEVYLHCWKGVPNRLSKISINVHTYGRVSDEKRLHTAEKPVELLKELIELASNPGDLVGDFFAGSGSTMEAAILSKRRARGCELDPEVFAKAVIRLKELFKGDSQ